MAIVLGLGVVLRGWGSHGGAGWVGRWGGFFGRFLGIGGLVGWASIVADIGGWWFGWSSCGG